jgi:type I restriction enzyme S subunit
MTATALQEIDVALPRRKWPRYPDYRSTGVGWLATMPTHWAIKRLRYVVRFPTKGEVRDLPLDTPVSFAPMEAVGEYGGLSLDQTRPIEEVLNGYTYFRNGDVLVSKITPCFENGKGALAEGLENGLGFGTTELHVLRAGAEIRPKYLFYLTLGEHFRKLGTAEMYGAGGQKRVPERFLQNLRHPLPPLDEQRAIAAFIDRETARIDELIAKKQRLIELLKEKRQAVISRAVTKGLNPDAPMKPSGIDWLGDVPSYWKVAALRYFASFGTGSTPDRGNSSYWNGVIPWVKTGEINYEPISATEESITEDGLRDSACWIAPKGTLLIALYGQGDTRGRVAILNIPAAFNQACVAISPKRELLVDYLHAYFEFAYSHIRDVGNETTQMNMSMDYVRKIPVAVPPVEEQLQIIALVANVRDSLKSTCSAVSNAIHRLSEYRSALITAAVTGQIDVRQFGKEAT